ncbi:MAG: AraC family transcriptional regulator [Saprospiraceae bacterium]|jgi:AraC-like DNA-binding protein|nr:AraC family transcriptional regulator [Saprospiraceae bacterium]MDP4915379.1 AraC family transcriptional regulator [Saprospiraceae bacterium]MDP5091412.1 AraC family transcriptional regulator [Saprospiraceae bacterium]
MKPLLEKSIESLNQSFLVKKLQEPFFDPNWHFHPHYQLFTVIKGTGTRFIGDDIRHFEEGDTVFLGPNMPHLWRSDRNYFEKESQLQTEGIVVYFKEDFLGNDFFEKPEMFDIKSFLKNSERGLDLTGTLGEEMVRDLNELLGLTGFEGISKLLNILHKLSVTNDYQYISSTNYTNTHKISETERMRIVHEYVLKHFKENINLSTVASLSNMTEAAFCRYFKSRTNKTFSDFVKEIRIGNACKMLQDENKSISQTCYESGYNTVSNFNNQFKSLKGVSPLQYQKLYRRT